jgi:hypothetical protein
MMVRSEKNGGANGHIPSLKEKSASRLEGAGRVEGGVHVSTVQDHERDNVQELCGETTDGGKVYNYKFKKRKETETETETETRNKKIRESSSVKEIRN